ncbi:NAD-dependent malic enzyme, mitochondrial, partial [Orchesella cincta]
TRKVSGSGEELLVDDKDDKKKSPTKVKKTESPSKSKVKVKMISGAQIPWFQDLWFWLFVTTFVILIGVLVYMAFFGSYVCCGIPTKAYGGGPREDIESGEKSQDFNKGPAGARTLFKMDPRRDKMGQRNYHEVTGDNVCPSMIRGIDFIRDPRLNKGMAFSLEERQSLGIHGLIPPRFKTQEEQVKLCKENVERYQEDLNKYIYLVGLQDRNERLFYRLIAENVEQMMPLVYTPTVGLACQKFGLIYRRPRGLFITIHDKGHIYQVLRNWPEPDSLLDDPYYIGLRHKRIQGPEYDEFLDEFMQAVVRRYGQNTLIQFEDFANHNAFRLLAKYRDRYCTFNDDIQGTAAVAVAGILASLRITKSKLSDHRFLFLGAGEAALGIAMLITQAMVKSDGVTAEEAASRVFLSDSKGLLVKTRSKDVSAQKQIFLKDLPHLTDFAQMIEAVKPTAILGAAAARGAFNTGIIKRMAELNERPIIFALSNPTSKAECTAAEAYEHSDGRAIFASGSPFPNFEWKGKTFVPGQGNNAYIFPGVSLAVIASGIHHISEDVFLLSAQTLANIVTQADLDAGRLYPPLTEIQNVSVIIAKKIMEDAYEKDYAYTYPEPKDKEAFLKEMLYDYHYDCALPVHWNYPAAYAGPENQ